MKNLSTLLVVFVFGTLLYFLIVGVQMLANLSMIDVFLALCALGLFVGLTLTKTNDGRLFWAISGILLLIATIIVYAF